MNTDCYYEIGYLHTICEDYALTGKINNDISYAIVCDGCSSSKDVDVGARLLAYSAATQLKIIYSHKNNIGKKDNFEKENINLRRAIITMANSLRLQLGLSIDALNSTLLIIVSDALISKVFIFGDGGYVTKFNDCIIYNHIEYESDAPYYLAYLLDSRKNDNYSEVFGKENINIKTHYFDLKTNKWKTSIKTCDFNREFIYNHTCFSIDNAIFIALVSDGVVSYREPIEQEEDLDLKIPLTQIKLQEINYLDIIQRMVAYKNVKGEFVKRRMNRIKRDCVKENLFHYDDISVATIIL